MKEYEKQSANDMVREWPVTPADLGIYQVYFHSPLA